MITIPTQLSVFLKRIVKEPEWDPGAELYGEHYRVLKEIVIATGEQVEGNLFTGWPMPDQPLEALRGKRRNYTVFTMSGNSILEIGFNAGHSAMLALLMNPEIKMHAIDIGVHKYTRPCYEYLKSLFGDRLILHIGDSRDILPILRREQLRYDLYHIDGGHGFATAQSDLCNILDFRSYGSTLLIDDTHDAMIDALCDFYELRGDITRMKLGRLWSPTPNWFHALFRMHPGRAG